MGKQYLNIRWSPLILSVWFDSSLYLSQQFFSHVEAGLSGLNQYKAVDTVSCSRKNTVILQEASLELATLSSLV